jgi:hypothetical protein
MTESNCSKTLISIIIVYIVSFMYVLKKHTKFWGYVMLIIAYILSFGYVLQFQDNITVNFTPIKNILNTVKLFSEITMFHVFFLCLLCLIFLNVYSLIKVLNAYHFRSSVKASFDLELNEKHQKELKTFDESFLVGIVSSFVFIYLLAGKETKIGIDVIDKSYVQNIDKFDNWFSSKFKSSSNARAWLKLIPFIISFVCGFIQLGSALQFSKIKKE